MMIGKRGRPPKNQVEEKLFIDDITEKPLSILISEIKNLMRTYRNEIDVKVIEKGGKVSEIEIGVRIQL